MTPPPPIESFERLGAAFPLTADTERKRMLVIVNPYATTVSDRLKNLVVYALQGRYEVEAVDTTGNGRRFTFSCGIGIDASVVATVDAHPRLKSRFGPYYYTWAALSTFWRSYVVNPPRMVVELPGGETFRGVTAIVQNGDPFTYFQNRPLQVAEGATLT